jgi:hypothetical protein
MRLALGALMLLALIPGAAFAQEGQIAGTVRDTSGAVMPGVTVEVTSPALIEKVRTAVTDDTGQYRITNLPVGTYAVSFTLEGFNKQQRSDVVLTTGFTAPVNVTLAVGQQAETIIVRGETPTVDVQNARQVTTFSGDDLQELPTSRNITSILSLTPGIVSSSNQAGGLSGVCVGGAGVFCNPNISDFNSHASANDTVGGDPGLRQGRIMVDGVPINSGAQGLITGMTAGYVADIANAQEVNIQISGALGESETGGAAINIVPRTGGNRFAGSFNNSYTQQSWIGTNNDAYPYINSQNGLLAYDYDIGGTYSGPIKRDRVWFYVQGRDQGKKATPQGGDFFYNANEGKWGANYIPDRSSGNVEYKNTWRNLSLRTTVQATRRDKFNFNWDEQDSCQDPCDGVVSVFTSPESWWSVQTRPNRLQQISWTNPLTNRLLFEAGLSITAQHYDTSRHRYIENPRALPRVSETGETASLDLNGVRTNTTAGATAFTALTSGSLNSQVAGGGAEARNNDNYRLRGSAAYVTGTHNAKVGYEGAFFSQEIRNEANDPRMTYNFVTPAANCAATNACGNTSLYFPTDPANLARRPVPTSVAINTGVATLDERAGFAAFYAQDQWTMKRLTLSGAIRYDQSWSSYGETCVGPDVYIAAGYCTPASDGVSYKDITPRWSAAWDLFGNGKTAIKYNMGKFLGAAGLNGTYVGANPARRTVNTVTMNWSDTDGDRMVDCNLLNVANGAFVANGECTPAAFQDYLRFGRDPLGLDEAGTPIGLANTQCGRTEQGIPAAVQAYCARYGDSLLEGWGVRRNEWQLGIGVQHEILPRLSAEVTYNRRKYGNQTVTDQLNIGCDRYNGAQDVVACQDGYLNYTSPQYDFLTVTAPSHPAMVNGGGYIVRGAANPKAALPTGQPQAQTLMQELEYSWSGIDTNFTWRAPGGLRVNGGTSTGRSNRDTCYTELDGPNVRGRDDGNYAGGCRPHRPFQTRINGSAAYTIPKVDVLVSSVFQVQPGVERAMNVTYTKDQVAWEPNSAYRATSGTLCTGANAGQTGCFVVSGGALSQTTYQVNVLDFGDLYGESIWNVDLKLAKNLRFGNKRVNLGVDVYNVFNNDSVDQYVDTWTFDNPATPAVEVNNWGNASRILSPRFARLSVQFFF